jgi:rhodanese-related sulfurtransferase
MKKKFYKIPFSLPAYRNHEHPTWEAWAPAKVDAVEWYRIFEQRVLDALGKEFLPVVRLADGEFSFLFGQIRANPRWPLFKRLRHNWLQFYRRKMRQQNFQFRTRKTVSSADYTQEEWRSARAKYAEDLKWISEIGLLAPQLAFLGRPTMEQFQLQFKEWIGDVGIEPSLSNICQFYFVYALFLGSEQPAILQGKRVLVVHGATGGRAEKIQAALRSQGASEVGWLSISNDRSLFDRLDVAPYMGKFDLVVVGAGVGKPGVIRQLEPLSVPVIDIGYVFEIWIDPECRFKRPFCASDTYYDADKVRVHPTMRYIQDCR